MSDLLDRLKSALAGHYAIREELGSGGMATVYLADDLKHDREVAVKILHPELAASLGADRFLQEIRVTAKMSHPHVLPLYDSGEADGFLYYVMPLVIGESLRDLLNHETQLPIEDAIRITREAAEALAHAHGHGLIHRDVKPGNILLSDGHAIVADFGISRAVSQAGGAKLTQTGMVIGTPAYMSPEQSAGDPNIDARSDVYALGCVLYEMLTGQIPFPAPTAQAMMARHTMEPVPPPRVMRPSIPPELEDVLVCALSKSPADRFKSAAEFGRALAAVHVSGTPHALAAPPFRSTGDSGAAPTKRRALLWRWVGAAGLVLLVIAAALTGWLVSNRLTVAGRGADRLAPVTSVAVLPFDDASEDASNEYFAQGVADELTDVLAKIDEIRVAARRSTIAFGDRSADPRTIGRELDVQAILEGSVRKSGDRVQITVRLVDARDGSQRWSSQYDRTVDDIFAVQEEIATSIASALLGELREGRGDLAVEALTRDPMAHDKYLWGQFNLSRGTREGAADAVDNFTMALGFDSVFAGAYAGLSDAHLALVALGADGQQPPTFEAARSAAEAALRLNPNLARARASLGLVKFNTFDWRGAEAEYVRALEASPDDPLVRERYANLLASEGRVEDALAHARVAVERDRLSTSAWHTLLKVLRADGQYTKAIEAGQEILQLNANDPQAWLALGLLFLLEDRPADATDALERYAELGAGDVVAFRTFVEAAARFARDGVIGRVPPTVAATQETSPVQLAVLHQMVGAREATLAALERAHRQRHPDLTSLRTRPELASLSETVRFRVIVADLGLALR